MSVNKLLLWEKHRPKKFEDIILLPRVRKYFENGINNNYIFYGGFGTGKTSLARILVGRYTKDKPFLELNSSLFTSIDVLRNEIEDFCKFTPMMESKSDIKYIFLDEFERVSPQFQDAFKAFIEKYNKNVRFIITTNHINKITDGIKSRIPQINFDAVDLAEERYLKKEIYKRITNVVLVAEQREIPKESLIEIITKKFPDFRSILVEVQNYFETGENTTSISNVSVAVKNLLYNILYDSKEDGGSYSYEDIYHFLMTNFGAEKIDVMITLLGKPFIQYCLTNNKSVDKLFECNFIIADYTSKLDSSTDPIILGMTIIGKIRNILK